MWNILDKHIWIYYIMPGSLSEKLSDELASICHIYVGTYRVSHMDWLSFIFPYFTLKKQDNFEVL